MERLAAALAIRNRGAHGFGRVGGEGLNEKLLRRQRCFERNEPMTWLGKEAWPWWQAGLFLGLLNIAAFGADIAGGLIFGAGMLLLGF
jgi:hypothetical protein